MAAVIWSNIDTDGAGGRRTAIKPGTCGGIDFDPTKVLRVAQHLGHNGAGAVATGKTVVGDVVNCVLNITDSADVTSSFESVVTVAGQVQQSAATDLSAKQCIFFVVPQN